MTLTRLLAPVLALALDGPLALLGRERRRFGDGRCSHPRTDCCDYCCPGDGCCAPRADDD